MRRIIDNKRIELTNDEWTSYQKICRSYDRPNFRGEELFKDHFETNEHGTIIFVRPPEKKYSSLEVFCFLISIMTNQHLRLMREQATMMVKEAGKKIDELVQDVKKLEEKVEGSLEDIKRCNQEESDKIRSK